MAYDYCRLGHGHSSEGQVRDTLFNIAIKTTYTGRHVLYLTTKPLNRFADSIRSEIRDLFKMIIFTYVDSPNVALDKILELQRWQTRIPGLIIIESVDYMAGGFPENVSFQQKLFLSVLTDTIRTLSLKNKEMCNLIISINDKSTLPFELYFTKHNIIAEIGSFIVNEFFL